MTLPNFLVIGAQKSGTTWVSSMLRQHPAVYMPRREVHYFNTWRNYKRGIAWYERHFAPGNGKAAVGEKTPGYLWIHGAEITGRLPDSHRRIHEALPDVKLIAVLRNPVNRALSHIHDIMKRGRISPLQNLDDVLTGAGYPRAKEDGIIERGRYYPQIKAYQEYFDPSQMLILIFEEDVVQQPAVGLQKLCEFLHIDSSFPFSPERERRNSHGRSRRQMVIEYYVPPLRLLTKAANRLWPSWKQSFSKPWKSSPSESMIRDLYRLYADDNEHLFELLKRRPPSWQPPAVTADSLPGSL
jgi:hypothetical protein